MSYLLKMENEDKFLNDYMYTMYYNKLKLLVLSLFGYENLPNHIKSEWIEKILYHNGEGMLFDGDNGIMITKMAGFDLNSYDEPINLIPHAINYQDDKTYTNGVDAVVIKNNALSLPSDFEVRLFAYQLADITLTQMININAQKTPILIACRDKQRLTLMNVYKQYKGNAPLIVGDKDYDMGSFTVLKTDAPIVFDKLQLHKHQIMNEFLTMFGINNANQDKKERLVDDEVQANNESVQTFSNTMFLARKTAVDEINRIFSTNIKVKKNVINLAEFGLNSEGDLLDMNGSKGSEGGVV